MCHFKAYFAEFLVVLGRVCRSPSMSTCYGRDGLALHGRSRDFFRYAIFLLYTGDPRWQLRCCPPVSALTCPELKRKGKRLKYNGNTALLRSRIAPRKVQECLLTRAPSTRPSSVWWEPPRPWSSAVSSRGSLRHLGDISRVSLAQPWIRLNGQRWAES